MNSDLKSLSLFPTLFIFSKWTKKERKKYEKSFRNVLLLQQKNINKLGNKLKEALAVFFFFFFTPYPSSLHEYFIIWLQKQTSIIKWTYLFKCDLVANDWLCFFMHTDIGKMIPLLENVPFWLQMNHLNGAGAHLTANYIYSTSVRRCRCQKINYTNHNQLYILISLLNT